MFRIFSYILIFFGISTIVATFALDLVGLSDPGLGPKQRVLLFIGISISLVGIAAITPAARAFARQTLLTNQPPLPLRQRLTNLITIAIWFGIVTGLVEGVGFLLMERYVTSLRVWIELQIWTDILWIAPLFNTAMFVTAALILAGVSQIFPPLSIRLITVWLFAFGTAVNWITLALMPWTIHVIALMVLSAGIAVTFARWFRQHENTTLRFWVRSTPVLTAIVLATFIGIRGYSWMEERSALSNLPPAEANLPNVLFIVIDTLRADHLSSYGHNHPTSPNIDELAQEGVLFETTISSSSWTAPSHASMLTGGFGNEHGVLQTLVRKPVTDPDTLVLPKLERKTILNKDIPVLPELMQEKGYRTGAFSANPIFFTRTQGFGRGFTRFEDYFHSINNMFASTVYARKIMENESWWWKQYGPKPHPRRKLGETVSHTALRWIRRDTDRPFFAFLNYFDVHAPYQPPEPYRSQFSGLNTENEASINHLLDSYDGSIAYVDAQIGQLLRDIGSLNLDRELFVVITSDHGEAFGEHGVFQHAHSLYREEIYVPLIIHYPGNVPSDLRVTQPVSIASLPATVLSVIDDNGAEDIFTSPSLALLWENPDSQKDWPFAFAEIGEWPTGGDPEAPSGFGSINSLVSEDWHYIEHEVFGTELYDWNNDPLEEHDLSESVQGQELLASFKSYLQTFFSTTKP